MSSPDRGIEVIRYGSPTPYTTVYDDQIARRTSIERGEATNALFLLEHMPTITLGRTGHEAHILHTPDALKELGIDLVNVDRGGDVTYHGPGQLVAYSLLNLAHWEQSVQWYLRALEDVIIATLVHYGIHGERMTDFTGVWVDGAKVAAVGIGVHQWVSFHGISINLNPDLRHWQMIVPCGIPDKPITTLNALLDTPPTIDELMDTFEAAFLHHFEGVRVN